ncbi:5'_nucleotidase family protein [Hexamita inflata]|uniref:5' nucleotidase family protein n=1 Tax=Hexamita inflata TaxID=28002 RepID=A0AA86ULT5_9EUKA|nr:5' nucleotidase family protein [Hexamita inflata]CAI9966360.1 5' nucleotidase family protein [Hexamita inflata]
MIFEISIQILTLDMLQISDVHGYVSGQRHDKTVGDLATLLSFKEQLLRLQPEVSQYSILVGDACEGTGLSDLTVPKCSLIYEAMSQVNFSCVIPGNHDVGSTQSLQWLKKNEDTLFPYQNYVSSNVFFHDHTPLGRAFKYETLQNGLRVLTLGFLVAGFDEYEPVYVIDQVEALQRQHMQDMLIEYGIKTDLLVIAMHVGSFDAQVNKTVKYLRNFFNDRLAYKIPIALLTAHSHRLFKLHCEIETDSIGEFATDDQCFNVEAGNYLKFIVQTRFQFEPITYIYNGQAYSGHKILSVQTFPSDKNSPELLSERLKIPVQEFDTKNALLLREKIIFQEQNLGLRTVQGFSKQRYVKQTGWDSENSIFRFWTYSVYPNIIFQRDFVTQKIVVSHSGSLRSDIYPGEIVLDDLAAVNPFDNVIVYFKEVKADVAQCAMNALNSNDSYCYNKIVGDKPVDIITTDYDKQRIQDSLGKCGVQSTAQPYPIFEPGIFSTNQILQVYVAKYMQKEINLIQKTINEPRQLTGTVFGFAVLGVFVVFAVTVQVFTCSCKKKRSKYQPIVQMQPVK